ncbi:DUF4190 domain-containing protein [Rhodococcus sp. D2-41]|uniref:DUF4190 domain-containing protein n=1 Tax=Speluncibacter jeojiensis TaxID=2710754 RepID=A0A9X4M443_9ACTN|nr:DUF4190 domain-containing protein [Rhodococcus sp. D2-41]MDG3009498.1 DUF4190 domain-containing protein [Rhodococcus sp. D2-41]MDG3016427.1 DUF4190 domain-containing protein [Corynebacteriales bacterium D3-21]
MSYYPAPGPDQQYPHQQYPQQPYPPQPYPAGPYPPPYGPPGYHPPAQPRNGLGIAALTIGLVSIVLAPTIVLGIPAALVGIGLGIAAYLRTRRGEANNPGIAIGGMVSGALGILGAILMLVLFISAAMHNSDSSGLRSCLDRAQGDPAAVMQCHLDYSGTGDGGRPV